jgi:hypothetical protein
VQPSVGFCLGERLCVRCCPVFLLFQVWVSLDVGWLVWCFGGFQTVTGLTGASHRSDQCGAT